MGAKLDILLGMILTLLHRGKVSANELASKFCVSTRTIYRYTFLLDSCGVPITTKCGRGGGISIYNTYKLNNMFFTVQEKMTLITVCSHIKNKDMQKTIQQKLLAIN